MEPPEVQEVAAEEPAPERPALTERQRKTLAAIQRHTKINGVPPTIVEIRELLGMNYWEGVIAHLNALKLKGYIVGNPATARTVAAI